MRQTQNSQRVYAGLMVFFLVISCLVYGTKQQVEAAIAPNGTVTASSLNIRASAKAAASSLGKIQKGTQVTILSTKKDSIGDVWYKITASISSKNVEGYVHSKYVEQNPVYSYIQLTGSTTATMLNIRKSAATTAAVLAKVPKGTRVVIVGEKKVSGVKWVKVTLTYNKTKITGYTHSTYVKRDVTTLSGTEYQYAVSNTENLPVYTKANTYTTLKAKLVKNQDVIILGKITVNGTSWYKLKLKMNDTTVYGYVNSSGITKKTGTITAKEKLNAKVIKPAKTYQIATTVAKNLKSVSDGQKVTVTGIAAVNSVKWYRCKFSISGKSYDGYIPASFIQLDADAEFEQSISEFPQSYKAKLRALHEAYPNWIFVPLKTGLDWNTVIENESRAGRNTIQSNVPRGGAVTSYSFPFSYLSTAPGAYNWATDRYSVMDGSNWYTASSQVIKYYMDPRNSLTESAIFQYEALSYDEKQKASVVTKILEPSFMNGAYECFDRLDQTEDKGAYTGLFMAAAKESGASPYFLAARALQELGIRGSNSVSGVYPGYEGIYNFYNIGANDSAGGGAIANGLRWAGSGSTYLRPWTSISKAVRGGAHYIAASYINKGQNTLYLQKFNVVYAPLFSHQYMTNVMAPTSEARTKFNSYQSMGIHKDTYVFYIPVYENMPASPCQLPVSAGNPNSYVKTLTASYGGSTLSLTPTFNYLNLTYTMVVPNYVSEIALNGTPISSYASISGLGTYSLEEGNITTIKIKCTAGNGTSTTYTLKVSRLG